MRKVRNWPGLIPAAALLAGLSAIGMTTAPSPTSAADNCLKLEAFSANIISHGGSTTVIPAAGFLKARQLLQKTSTHEAVEADAAYFDEMPDGSSGIVFANKSCISAIWLTPPFVPRATLKSMLLEDKPQAPVPAGEQPLAPGMARA